MAWRVQDPELDAADTEDLAILHRGVVEDRRRGPMHHDRGLRGGDEIAVAGDVVGMRVGLEHVGDAEALLARDPEIFRNAIPARIDDDGLSRLAAPDEVREAPRLLVDELLKDHRRPSRVAHILREPTARRLHACRFDGDLAPRGVAVDVDRSGPRGWLGLRATPAPAGGPARRDSRHHWRVSRPRPSPRSRAWPRRLLPRHLRAR